MRTLRNIITGLTFRPAVPEWNGIPDEIWSKHLKNRGK